MKKTSFVRRGGKGAFNRHSNRWISDSCRGGGRVCRKRVICERKDKKREIYTTLTPVTQQRVCRVLSPLGGGGKRKKTRKKSQRKKKKVPPAVREVNCSLLPKKSSARESIIPSPDVLETSGGGLCRRFLDSREKKRSHIEGEGGKTVLLSYKGRGY